MNWRFAQTFLALAAAVAPLLGVFLWSWSAREVVLIYWLENVVIGFWQIVKMLLAGAPKVREFGGFALAGVLFVSLFFLVHFGGFCAGHGLFLLALTGQDAAAGETFALERVNFAFGPFLFLQLLSIVIQQAWALMPPASLWSVASIFALRGLAVWQDFVVTGEWRKADLVNLMFEPYRRIVILHLAIVLGAVLVMAVDDAWPVLALIVLGKLFFDLRSIWREREAPKDQS